MFHSNVVKMLPVNFKKPADVSLYLAGSSSCDPQAECWNVRADRSKTR